LQEGGGGKEAEYGEDGVVGTKPFSMLTLPEDASDDPTTGVFSYNVKQWISNVPFPSPKKDGSLGRQYSDAYLILSGSTEAEVEAAVAVWEEVFVYSNECRCLMADVITHISEVVCQDGTSFQAIAKLDFSRLEGDSALWVPPWKKKSLCFRRVGGGAPFWDVPGGKLVFCKRDVVIGYTPGPSSMPCSDIEYFSNLFLEPGLPLAVQSLYYDKTTCRIRHIFVKITPAENPDKCYALSGMKVVPDKYYVPKRVLRGGMVEMVPENPLDFQETKWTMYLCPGRSSPYELRLKHPDVNLYRELWDGDYLFDFFFEHDVPYEVLQCTGFIGYDIDLELEDMAMDMVEK
jgi:hypothetical protein